jgi:segregation and condensation protein B
MARLEATLLVADAALSPRRIAQLASLADATEARTLVNRLNDAYEQAGTPFRIERVAAGYRLFTLPQFSLWLGKLHHRDAELKLSPPAMETLTVIAYRQPITRADVEAIRGVQCAEMIKQLMERSLVRIGGEDDSLGRPFLYETTRRFLETFGLRDLEDLPLAEKLRRPGGTGEATPESPPEAAPSEVAVAS